ncbi:NYN domain-containing protein [Cellulomonas sp.]|uniref:NYN domain-containing protein n=1 Tax=Cellulomonas sp. TaxID=40001 RepID=UPI002811087D|nr:NYN domain-containing protein [Cellulomonas sp.]
MLPADDASGGSPAARARSRPAPATSGAAGGDGDVPAPLRGLLVRVAADVLGRTEPVEVPPALQSVRRFAPRRRATAGAVPLWTALCEDAAFRARVARVWSAEEPEEASEEDEERVGLGSAAAAWLQGRPWRHLVPVAGEDGAGDDAAAGGERLRREVEQLRTALGLAREAERSAREELVALRRELRRLRSDADRARSDARRLAEEAAADVARAEQERRAAEAEAARAQEAQRAAAAERAAARDEVRTGRALADARTRLLLDTLVDAAAGLRAELALPPVDRTPADLVASAPTAPAVRPTSRGRAVDDPALVDDLLRMPRAHLLVDGYNVSKTGWPALPLADQRRVLVDALARLAARTGAEVTCCFDGAEGHTAAPLQRGVRVLFSSGEIADDLLRRLVTAEPAGRVLVVVTSDREVARDVEAAGAWVLPSAVLVDRVRRG